MKKIILLTICLLCCSILLQAQDKIKELILEGIKLHDQGDFEGAISKYDEALQLDASNITALGEKALSLLSLEKYETAIQICKAIVETQPNSPNLDFVYTTYGNALDLIGKPDQALNIYDQGIAKFPDYFQLHFNKGITLSRINRPEEALAYFEKSVSLNPEHPGSHNAIARIHLDGKKKIPSLMAFCRFLILEPQGDRATSNLPFVREIMQANVKKTGENNVTITLSPDILEGASKKKKKKLKPVNDFSMTELLLSMSAALDYDQINAGRTEQELFISKFGTFCQSLAEQKNNNSGFYWEYYAPYFIELKNQNLVETFTYIIYASSDDPTVQDWLKTNKDKISKFYQWSEAYNWSGH